MSFKQAIRTILTGRSSRYFDDELIQFNLKEIVPTTDDTCSSMRLNVVLPSLSASGAFGGLTTQVNLPIQMFSHGLAQMGWKLRFISLKSADNTDNLAKKQIIRQNVSPDIVSFHFLDADNKVPVSANDVFLGSLWFCHVWVLPLLEFQLRCFGGPKRPYISLIQDYEPSFHPWSSAFMLSRGSYDSDWPKRVIFNSSELAEYYKRQGHKFERSAIFEPVLNNSLRDSLQEPNAQKKERRILFYGRPDDRRNCFYLGRRALEIWSERYEESPRWKVISVGAKYPPFKLANGKGVEVLGKLPLNLYVDQLQRAAVGLSLMASPHPSYPPLEMAHFGALTISNSFDCKSISAWHENLIETPLTNADAIAEALIICCEQFAADEAVGLRGKGRKAHYVKELDSQVIQELISILMD
jgi:hypothetical protein